MNLEAFTDELVRLRAGREIVKTAASEGALMHGRFGAVGALSNVGLHGLSHLKAMVTGDPWDKPQGTALGAAGKGAVGGLAASGVLALLGRIASRGKKG